MRLPRETTQERMFSCPGTYRCLATDTSFREVQGLEEKIRELEAQVRDDLPPATPNYDDSNTSQVGAILSRDHRNAVDVNTHYVGEESGTK